MANNMEKEANKSTIKWLMVSGKTKKKPNGSNPELFEN